MNAANHQIPLSGQTRIGLVSKVLKWVSALAIIVFVVQSILVLVLPVVAVGRQYHNPRQSSKDNSSITEVTPGSDVEFGGSPLFGGNRWILDLYEAPPEVRLFSYMPGPSDILAGREWVARIVAFLHTLYYAMGGILFVLLFSSYEKGRVFNLDTVRGLRWIGFWMIGAWLAGVLFNFSGILWREMPPIELSLGPELLSGLFLCLIAWIMEEGCRLAEEQALTV
jgi:hypothetical protein